MSFKKQYKNLKRNYEEMIQTTDPQIKELEEEMNLLREKLREKEELYDKLGSDKSRLQSKTLVFYFIKRFYEKEFETLGFCENLFNIILQCRRICN